MTPPYTPGGYGGALEVGEAWRCRPASVPEQSKGAVGCRSVTGSEPAGWSWTGPALYLSCRIVCSQALLAASGVYAQHAGGEYKGGQGFSTLRGLNCTDSTRPGTYFNPPPTKPFDLIYFNYGLHDADNLTSEAVPVEQYAANVATIYRRLGSFSKSVMWRTTTPVGWQVSDTGETFARVHAYNAAANASLVAAAQPGRLLVHDLWTDMVDVCGWNYSWDPTPCVLQLNGTRPNGLWTGNPHLSAQGIAFAAKAGYNAIMAALGGASVGG
jgi:hypothetical protein